MIPHPQTIYGLLNTVYYISYATQRDNGMTHAQCVSIGLGNDAMRDEYDREMNDNQKLNNDGKL